MIAFGQHISEIVNEINTLGKFIRASRGNQFAQNQQALSIVEDAVNHYSDLKRKAKKMIGKRGYKEIFSTYDPMIVTELDETIESVREVFVNSAVDSRIEEALPILAKIRESTMKEANQFENWTNQIMEGTWALVDTEEEIQMLKDLLAKPLPCGPDGEYATEQLYDLIGDDQLFDEISELADEEGADADCREIVKQRAEELGIDVGEIDHSVYGEGVNEDEGPDPQVMQVNKKVMSQNAGVVSVSDITTYTNPGIGSNIVVGISGANIDDLMYDKKFRAGIEKITGKKLEDGESGENSDESITFYVVENINENPTDQETASSYQAGQAAAAAGKERSLEMGMGGQDLVKTAGGSDVEEGMDSFVNPNDQDGTDNEKAVDPMADDDLDPEDMTEDDNNYMSADELKKELISDLNHLYDQASANDFTDNDHILDEMGDYFKDMHANADDDVLEVYKMARDLVDAEPAEVIQFAEKGIQALGGIIEDAEMKDLLRLAGRDNVNEAKSPPEVINPTKDSSPADLKAAIKYAKYMKAKMDTDKAKATYDKEIDQLQGWMKAKSVTKETQDIDTGKQALKAERDPMLERILHLAKG